MSEHEDSAELTTRALTAAGHMLLDNADRDRARIEDLERERGTRVLAAIATDATVKHQKERILELEQALSAAYRSQEELRDQLTAQFGAMEDIGNARFREVTEELRGARDVVRRFLQDLELKGIDLQHVVYLGPNDMVLAPQGPVAPMATSVDDEVLIQLRDLVRKP